MQLLLFHCRHLKFKDVRKSKRPKGLLSNSKVSQDYDNTLASFICIEKWDTEEYVHTAVNIITKHLNFIKKNRVVVIPFVHLSYYIADYRKAIMLLDSIAATLREKGFEVGRSSFGYHKDFEFTVSKLTAYGHPGSVAYRRIPENIEGEFMHLANELGVEKAIKLLKKKEV